MAKSKQQQTTKKLPEGSGELQEKHERITDTSFAPDPRFTEADKALFKNYELRAKELFTDELYSHISLRYTVGNYYKEMVIRFCNQLIEEYNCKTPSEIGLAEIAASSYAKYLDYSDLLSETSHKLFSNIISSSFSALSKEVDRSQRAFVSAILTLKQLKSPPMTVRIKAKNAFVAQNQQVNTANKDL